MLACQAPAQEEAIPMYHQVFGEGRPLLIINGGPGMHSEGFVPLAKMLSKNNRTIVFDQRGTGKSKLDKVNEHTITMDLMVEDMELLREKLGLESWAILGHSFGGMLAAHYASQHPERVDAMVLSSAGGLDMELFSYLDIRSRLSEEERTQLSHWTRQIREGDTTYHARLQRGKNLAPAYLFDKSHVPAVAERLTQGNMQVNRLVLQNMQAIDFDCKAPLKDFHKPVLIIQGKQDLIDEKTVRKAAAVLPNDTLVFIDQCAHYGWLEQPDEYLGAIENFLSELN